MTLLSQFTGKEIDSKVKTEEKIVEEPQPRECKSMKRFCFKFEFN